MLLEDRNGETSYYFKTNGLLHFPADDMVYEPTRFKTGIILYFRTKKAIRGDQIDMACYRLAVPHRAIRAGTVGDKDPNNSGDLLLFFSLFGDS